MDGQSLLGVHQNLGSENSDLVSIQIHFWYTVNAELPGMVAQHVILDSTVPGGGDRRILGQPRMSRDPMST